MIKFEKTIYSSITVPVTIKLQSPAINNLTLYLKSENYSSAILGYDYFLDTRINTADQKTLLFNSGEDSITINVIITNNISPEDTAIFSLRDNDNKIISFLLIKCEEFSLIKKMTDKSYIKVDTIIKEKKFLNCFVDYNYNDNDLEFYRNFAVHPLTNEKIPVWYADYVLSDY
jgi:leucyl-tRNA synthetase